MTDARLQKIVLFLILAGLVLVLPAAAATTSLTVKKLASDGTTVLDSETVDYAWMEANLPVYGDGVTHYYHQGPTFDLNNLWDPGETINVDSRDYGPAKGTDVKDLCDLVGGMNAGESVQIRAADGFNKYFDYDDVYLPEPELGRLVIAWYNPSYGGYVPAYDTGMRLIMFAGTTNVDGKYVFGDWDMHNTLAENRWHYNYDGKNFWPSSSGLSVQNVGEIIINSDDPAPVAPVARFSGTPLTGTVPLTVQFTDASTGTGLSAWAWDFGDGGSSTDPSPSHTYTNTGTYAVKLTVTGTAGSDEELKTDYVTVTPAEWSILLSGKISEELPRATFESLAAGNRLTFTDSTGTWSGIALWRLLARVDDSDPASFSDAQADLGYNVVTTASDGFSNTQTSTTLKRNDNWIVADTLNGEPLPKIMPGKTSNLWPLKIVGSGPTTGSMRVANITKIELKDFVAPPEIPVAAFSAVPVSGTVSLVVQFTDASTGTAPLTYAWDFGDGGSSTDASPSHTYNAVGTYTVTLTVTNGAGSDVEEKAAYISVTEAPVAPVALFSGTPTSGTPPLVVQFTDQSTGTGPLTYAWDFGDTGTSTEASPPHTYAAAGTYTVKLTVTGPGGVDDEEKAAYVTVTAAPTMDVLFDGTVVLTPGATFTKSAYNSGTVYTVSRTTPLGALDVAATTAGFTYDVTDKNFGTSGALLLDNIGTYLYQKTPRKAWYAYVNDVYRDGYNNPAGGLNLIGLANGDRVEFYFVEGTVADPTDLNAVKAAAKAAVKTVASTGVTPTEWTLALSGAKTQSVDRAYFENGLACPSSGHQLFWTDGDGDVWGGVPLWLLVGMVDDDPDVGPLHFNFNDDLAAQHYQVKVIASDGWSAIFDSADIARSSDYIVANTLNGGVLPPETDAGKPSWPLFLKGPAVLGGQQVGGIVRIELLNMPRPPAGWTIAMLGQVGDTITQQDFEVGFACGTCEHLVEWTDKDENVWSGVPLWALIGTVDDDSPDNFWTFSDAVAADGYTVKVTASDGFSRTFTGATLARNNNYIVANKMNGQPLPDTSFPLRLVGSGVTKPDGSLGGSAVGKIAKIEILELQTPLPAAGSYNLSVKGKITDMLSQAEIENGLACPASGHYIEWTQTILNPDGSVKETHVWSGFPLWFLAGWVDDRGPHAFGVTQAMAGYKVTVKATDGYAKDFTSAEIAWSNNYIIATRKDGQPLDTNWPLQLVGAALTKPDGSLGGKSVGKIAEIELTEFANPTLIPTVHIVKYGDDGTSVVSEATLDYTQMISQFDVIGDGTTVYKFQGVTMDPADIWGQADETKGGAKISNAVKGTRLRDLAGLVGGMGPDTDLVLVASDGYKTILPYTSVYTTPGIQARQGDAILAWYADGKYVPGYADGMRLFFMPSDHIYGQWDMHETMPAGYWHYYYQAYDPPSPYAPGILYPSAAGLSAKYVNEIRVYSKAETPWTLQLDGTKIGGITYTVAKTYFEQALACQFGANHKATYTDSKGRAWEGMPLWFLAGFVDDADQHSDHAFNEPLATAGYNVVITAMDGSSVVIDSRNIIRSSNYIVANSADGVHLPDSDSSWPLRLVGSSATGSLSIKGIQKIELVPIPAGPTLHLSPESAAVTPGQEVTYAVLMSSLPDGLAGYNISVSLADPSIGEITGVAMPAWAVLKRNTPLPADILWMEGVDLGKVINGGATEVSLGQVTIRGDKTGTTPLKLDVKMMTADGGAKIQPALAEGELAVHIPLIADFSADPVFGPAPLAVAFTDLSTGTPAPTEYLWDFGDGGSSTEQNPAHSYASFGTYTVTLTVRNAYSEDTGTKAGLIGVARYVEPFPELTQPPGDPDHDGLYEDINGNGEIDYDDIVELFWNMDWVTGNTRVGILPYDFNGNGYLDYDDIVLLFQEVE